MSAVASPALAGVVLGVFASSVVRVATILGAWLLGVVEAGEAMVVVWGCDAWVVLEVGSDSSRAFTVL